MAVYAWTRSRSLFSKLWSANDQVTLKGKVQLDKGKDFNEKRTDSSTRFLNALRDGGVFLS